MKIWISTVPVIHLYEVKLCHVFFLFLHFFCFFRFKTPTKICGRQLFFVISNFNNFISACANCVFFSNILTKMFTFTFLFIGGGIIILDVFSNLVFAIKWSIFATTYNVSKGPEQTALILQLESHKTEFTTINH